MVLPRPKKPSASAKTSTYEPEAVRTWPKDPRKDPEFHAANMAHRSNKTDNGFNHIDMPVSAFELKYNDEVEIPSAPFFTDDDHSQAHPRSALHKEKHYILLVREKLKLTKSFINTEHKLSLDPNRDMSKDPTAKLLATPPIPLSFATQEYIRDIVKITAEMEDYKDKMDDEGVDDKMQELAEKYAYAWQMVRTFLVGLMPGETEGQRMGKAEDVMVRELGKMIAEPGVDDENVEMGEDETGTENGEE